MYTYIQYALPKGDAEPVTKVRASTDTKTSTDENQTDFTEVARFH